MNPFQQAFWYPPLYQLGSAISKTVAAMNITFCRILETSLNILEMSNLFT